MGAEARAGRLTVCLGGEGRQRQQGQRDSRGRVVAGASSGSEAVRSAPGRVGLCVWGGLVMTTVFC